jgi:putative SOS response-associated peptidase YedK
MNVSDHPGVQALLELLGLSLKKAKFKKSFNVAPTANIWTVQQAQGALQLNSMVWGIIPHWAKPGKFTGPLINARAETIWEKPSFKNLIKSSRLIIPVTGFYEWQRQAKSKKTFYIRPTAKHAFAFGGIWQRSKEGALQCCIVTTQANQKMASIHDRMPVIIEPEHMEEWICGSDRATVERLMQPVPDDTIQTVQVSNYVNNARNEGPQCVEPLADSD